jgi:hypothetical protein
MKRSFDSMFGFIFKQPIHITLRQMRIIQVALIFSSQGILWYIVQRLEFLDPTQSVMAYGTIAAALIAAIWKGVDSLHRPNEADKYEKDKEDGDKH